ncbi:efflux RND transporter permease subunit [Azospira inquinata]|uniref:Efflux pump membrane transporter n=1 Tax=Azospira inquinata TaxID=2785627 RepID=A0A975SNS9_9RHOO|nr:efflux RND transporter permease subunit [Azospira inquinata]QWT45201.1 efflux RND transporter permease subunit [Azospira inquinata]QWT49466.1 efflux RND transporter permease subunit [Azospira inquinata]
MSRFFIDRPIFAWVIAIIIMLAGVLAITGLPISQYPNIAPPQVSINAFYPGASADTIEKTVTQLIEQNMKGLDGLTYMSSSSDSAGNAQITLTFQAGTNPDIAQVQVQNKLQLATPRLPAIVQKSGITVAKATPNFLMVLGFVSEDGRMSDAELADFVSTNIMDPISRVSGVGSIQLFGSPRAMRVWLDPNKLNNYKMVPADIVAAINAQNAEVSAGQLGGTPAEPGQRFSVTVTSQSLLKTPEEFRNILLRTLPDGSTVHLKDVARVYLGQESYGFVSRFNRKPATGMAINLATGANALATARAVQDRVAELEKFYPRGMKTVYPFDTTPFVRISIHEVVKTLVEAVGLVFLVMYLFLQNFRATLIPTIAVPVVLLGTFGVLFACGFSINTLTMFAMVLAIGLLVDDAIVVVENVERVMSEEGVGPKEATRRSMDQITGALVGIGLVLSAVFVPMAFFGGSTGVIYRQFSITIVSAMALSVLVALILTPALCVTFLRPVEKGHDKHHRGFFGWFNRFFERNTNRYQSAVGRILVRSTRFSLIYLLLVGGMVGLFFILPTSFLPDEDQGVIFTQVQLPPGATQESTVQVLKKVEDYFLNEEGKNVTSVFAVQGFSFGGSGQNSGIAFVMLKDWDQRKAAAQKAKAVANRAMGAFSKLREAQVFAFVPPAVMDLGNASGFDFQLQDKAGLGHEKLIAARNQLLMQASQRKDLVAVRPNGMDDSAQYKLDVDQTRAGALGLSMGDVNDVLATAWGGTYVNDFLDKNRTKKVYIQGDTPFRMQPGDLGRWYVRNSDGQMVPFSAFAQAHWSFGSPRLERYEGVPSVEILGEGAPGKSSGDAMKVMESLAAQLPSGIGYSWTGLSYQERLAGSQAVSLYAISMLVVFLCLAALYESWSVPFSVMLVVPLGVVGALALTKLMGLSNDVYFQVGLLTTIGLATKNAILIVEFAKTLQEQGKSLVDATLEAARMRLRPILMTSIAFGFGVLPLAISNGAGSGAQNAIGIGVLGGMLASTALGIFLIPLFFVQVRKYFSRDSGASPSASSASQQESQP